MGWATLWQPSKQELLGNVIIFHSSYIAQPVKSSSSGPLLSFGDAHDASEASAVEDLDLWEVSLFLAHVSAPLQ